MSLTDTIVNLDGVLRPRGEEVQPNKEMIGIGTANVAAGLFQGFAVSTSSSRTAVADQTGAKSQVTGLIGAGVVALLLLVFNGLLANLPQMVLAAVVISAAISLVDLATLRRYLGLHRSSLFLSLVATGGVVFFGVLQGILIAVVLSILLFFRRNWWPHGEVLGRIDGEEGWHSVNGGGPIVGRPGIVIFRWEAPLFFANAGMFRDRVRELVRTDTPKWVVLQCEAITDIDVTAADVLEQLDLELNEQGINIAFVELRSRLKDLVYDYGLFATLDADHFYDSIGEALDAIDTANGGRQTDA